MLFENINAYDPPIILRYHIEYGSTPNTYTYFIEN